MRMRKISRWMAGVALVAAFGCAPATAAGTGAEGASAEVLVGPAWQLMELNGRTAPRADRGRPATLQLTASRATGFLGCNNFAAGYELDDTNLRFAALISTRMACQDDMNLERDYGRALEATRSYRISNGRLELLGESGVVAVFTRATS
jgi:heat shock protein HslJ